MTRFADDRDDDYDVLDWGRWERNSRVCVEGKRGQTALAELEAALVALPRKVLIKGALADDRGDMCAVGVLVAHHRTAAGDERSEVVRQMADRAAKYNADDDQTEETIAAGRAIGLTATLSWVLSLLNDLDHGAATPEQRYDAVLRWVRRKRDIF